MVKSKFVVEVTFNRKMVKQLIMTHSDIKETPHNCCLRHSCPDKQKIAATVKKQENNEKQKLHIKL